MMIYNMNISRFYFIIITCLSVGLLAAAQSQFSYGAASHDKVSSTPNRLSERTPDRPPPGPSSSEDQAPDNSATIAPYRSAEITAETRGIIEAIYFKEGDFVEKGQVVILISKKRNALVVRRAVNTVKAAEIDLKRAQQETLSKEQILLNKATTNAEVLKAKGDEEIAQYRLEEAKIGLELADMDLEASEIKAPFSGYIARSYREPFESVDYSQRLFVLVDAAKVYAIAAISDRDVFDFAKGRRAAFISSIDKKQRFVGTVERIGKLLDPKSGTRNVYVVIDNPKDQLAIGMTGFLEPAK
jgi:RND family efflux transporter MFP subunit